MLDPQVRVKYQPSTLIRAINWRYNEWKMGANYNTDGVSIFDEDWDNLIILDAARYDYFSDLCEMDGELEHRISRGSTSKQFIRGNFQTDHLDTVYVSANFWYAQLREELGAIHKFVKTDRDAVDGRTSTPATVTATARDVAAAHPDKRLIVHYMQPHQPYLAGRGQSFDHGPSLEVTMLKNKLSESEVKDAYRANLELVLDHVPELIDDLPGKTVVTADHGELLNDRESPIPIRGYGHPGSIFVDELVKVPWFIIDSDERKEIRRARESSPIDAEGVEEDLRNLGYL